MIVYVCNLCVITFYVLVSQPAARSLLQVIGSTSELTQILYEPDRRVATFWLSNEPTN